MSSLYDRRDDLRELIDELLLLVQSSRITVVLSGVAAKIEKSAPYDRTIEVDWGNRYYIQYQDNVFGVYIGHRPAYTPKRIYRFHLDIGVTDKDDEMDASRIVNLLYHIREQLRITINI